jgi:hypothetical protein
MKPQSIGRVLGIGVRVAGRIAGHAVPPSQPNPQGQQGPVMSGAQTRAAGQAAGKATRGVARGVGGFLQPFGRVGGILWLEVTGVFFALFALVFGVAAWRAKPALWHGSYDKPFVVSAALVCLFVYLSVSSFLRAGKK